MNNVWKKIVTPQFLFNHLPTWVPKSPHCSQNSESAKIFAHFFGGLAPTHLSDTCLKKAPKLKVFFRLFGNLNFEILKINYLLSYWSFWDMIQQDVTFLSLDNQFILFFKASFHAKFGHEDKHFIWVSKCKNMDSFTSSIFLTIKN